MTVATVTDTTIADAAWANSVANDVNTLAAAGLGSSAIIELATTPVDPTNQQRWSSVHSSMMRYTGTQWVFANPNCLPTSWDCHEQGITNNTMCGPFLALLSSGSNLAPATGQPANHPGVISITCGVTANTVSGLRTLVTATGGGVAGLRFRAVVAFFQPNSTCIVRVGMHDCTSSADAVDGAYVEFSSATGLISFKTATASTRTTNATTLTNVSGTWYTIHIWFVTATTARCIMIKDDGTVVLDVTNSANVPGSGNYFGANIIAHNTSTTGGYIATVDWMGFGYVP